MRRRSKILKHWTHRTTAGAFECWHEHASEQRRMEEVCSKVVSHLMHRELAMALDTWRECAQKQRRAGKITGRDPDLNFVCWHQSNIVMFLCCSSFSRFLLPTSLFFLLRTASATFYTPQLINLYIDIHNHLYSYTS